MKNEIIVSNEETHLTSNVSIFADVQNFDHWQRMAKVFTSASMVPAHFKGEANLGNVLIVLNMSKRTGVDPFLLMQNIDDIQGKMALSSKYLIAQVNDSPDFTPIRYQFENRGKKSIEAWVKDWNTKQNVKKTFAIEDIACRAKVTDKKTGEELVGSWVSMEMAILEGWYTKKGSKWKTIPEQMLRYRAASFWASIYYPAAKLGMSTREEIEDIGIIDKAPTNAKFEELNDLAPEPTKSRKKAQQPADKAPQTIEIEPKQNEAVPTETEPENVDFEEVEKEVEPEPTPEPEPIAPTIDTAGAEDII